MKIALAIFCLIGFFTIPGCSIDPNEKANQLYVEASQLMQGINTEAESYATVFESYKNAKKKLQLLVSQYASSNVAVGLTSEKMKISGLTFSEFKLLEHHLEVLENAEKSPLLTALIVVDEIKAPLSKSMVLTIAARKYVEIGQWKKGGKLLGDALIIALASKKSLDRSRVLAKVTSALASILSQGVKYGKSKESIAYMLSENLKVIEFIKPEDKPSVLAYHAIAYDKLGLKDKADELFSKALEIAKTIHSPLFKSIYWPIIVGKYAREGDPIKALEAAKTVNDPSDKSDMLNIIAARYNKLGQNDKVIQLLSKALEVTETVNDPREKADMLNVIASSYAKSGQEDKAIQILSKSLDVAKSINTLSQKAFLFRTIGSKYSELGQKVKAIQLLSEALEMAEDVKKSSYKSSVLADIASGYAKLGQKNKADELFSKAFEIAERINNPRDKSTALTNLAKKHAGIGEKNKAFQLLVKSLEADKFVENNLKPYMLSIIGNQYVNLGQKDHAVQLFSKALEVVKTVSEPYYKSKALINIATMHPKQDRKLEDKTMTILHDILHEVKPIKGSSLKQLLL